MISSYLSIYNLGHAAIATLLHGPVLLEEKIDGSQISFCRRRETRFADYKGTPCEPHISYDVLEVRSKGAVINTVAPEGMFKKAVEYLKSIEDKIPFGY